MSTVNAFGISAEIPDGWEARIFSHVDGEPTLHAASFPLPARDGEFGTRTTQRMPHGGLFVCLTEYRTGEGIDLHHGLFANPTPRSLDPANFSTRTLLQARAGQSGMQRFFSISGRAFCLYIVASNSAYTKQRLAAASHLLKSLDISKHE
jgi:hypothetical protein